MPLINRCGGGGGTPQLCGQVENFVVVPSALSATLKWTAPNPDEDSSFVGVRIVRKSGSAPTGLSDGVVVYEGTALTYTDTGLTAGTTYYYRAFAYNAKKKYQTAMRVVKLIAMTSVSFSSMSWEEIGALSRMGVANSVFSVGDTKSFVLNGTVGTSSLGTYTFTKKVVNAFILGFNHNADVEGDNLIHLMLSKASSGNTGRVLPGQFFMMADETHAGWASTGLRVSILGGASTPTAPKSNTLMAALPAELRQVMRPALKYANNTYEYSKYDTSMFTKNSEYLTLPSQNEAYGLNNISYINSHINIYPAELTLMQQYDYFKAGNSVQAFLETDTSNNVRYWSRSADPGKSTSSTGAYYFPIQSDSPEFSISARAQAYIRPILFV